MSHLDGPRVGAGRPRLSADLVRNAERLRGFDHLVVNDGVDVGAARDDGAARKREAPELTVVRIRVIGGVTDVDRDGNIGLDALGRNLRTARTDFFLRGGHGRDRRRQGFLLGQAAEGFHANVGPSLVIEGAGDTDASTQDFGAIGIDGGVTDADDGEGVSTVVHADVDPHVVALRDALAVLRRK